MMWSTLWIPTKSFHVERSVAFSIPGGPECLRIRQRLAGSVQVNRRKTVRVACASGKGKFLLGCQRAAVNAAIPLAGQSQLTLSWLLRLDASFALSARVPAGCSLDLFQTRLSSASHSNPTQSA